jgi:hypothetical protein
MTPFFGLFLENVFVRGLFVKKNVFKKDQNAKFSQLSDQTSRLAGPGQSSTHNQRTMHVDCGTPPIFLHSCTASMPEWNSTWNA